MSEKSDKTDVSEIINKYPNAKIYESNPALLKRLASQLTPPKSDLRLVTEGDRIKDAEVLVSALLNERPVIICPVCNSGLKAEEGQTVPCTSNKCGGNQVVATKSMGYKFEAGTPDVTVILDFAPFRKLFTGDPNDLVAKVVLVTGKVDDFKRKDGKKSISVFSMKILRDFREGAPSPPPMGSSAPTAQPTPPKEEVKTNLPAEKIPPLKGWIAVMRKTKPNGVPEQTVKTYVETILKVKWEDVLPLLNVNETAEGKLYTFKE